MLPIGGVAEFEGVIIAKGSRRKFTHSLYYARARFYRDRKEEREPFWGSLFCLRSNKP